MSKEFRPWKIDQAQLLRGVSAYLATGRAKHLADAKRTLTGPLTKALREKLKRAGRRSRYRLRKQVVAPVFGQINKQEGSGSSCCAAATP
jgi:hypothetical protein